MRKVAVYAAAVVLFLVLLVLVLPRLVSVESLKPRVVAALEEKTGRRIDLSGLSLSLFPGIGVKVTGLTVSGDPRHPGERLLSVPETEIRMAITPLLTGRTEFTKFILRRPEIWFRTYADGTHSATDIVKRLAGEKKPAVPPAGKKEKEVAVAIRAVRVERATLLLVSEEAGGKESRWEISPITVRMSGIGDEGNDFEISSRVEGQVRGEVSFAGRLVRDPGAGEDRAASAIRGEGKLFGQKVSVTGKVFASQEPVAVDLAISFPGIKIDTIPEILKDPPAPLAKAQLEGVIPLTVKVTGSLESPEFEARADLTRAGGTIKTDPELRKVVGTPCTILAKGRYAPDRLVLSNAELRIPPLSVAANAVVNPASGAREWAVSAVISSLAEFGKLRGAGPLPTWSPEGRLTAAGKGRRKSAKAAETYEGSLILDGVGLRVPGRAIDLRKLAGKITLTPRAVTFSRLGGLLNGKRFSLTGTTSLGPVPAGQVELRMAYLDVDGLFPSGEEGEKKEEKPPPEQSTKKERREGKISARIRVAIDAGKARGVEFTDLKGLVRYEKGNVHLDSVTARMYGGNVAVSGIVGLASPTPDFSVKVAVEELAAEEILSRKTSLKDFLSGPVSLSVDLGGGMKDFADFSRTASGSGSIKITGGKIKGLDLLGTAAGLAGLSSLVPGALPGGEAKKETTFSDFSASFRVEGGKIRTDSLRIISDKLGLAGKAAVGFDRTLDFRGSIRLSKEMSKRFRGKAGKFLVGPEGEVEIPLILTGTLTSPAASLDTKVLAKGVGERLLKGLIEKLHGQKPPPGGDNAAPAEKPEKPKPFREVEEILQKFLPGKREGK